MIAAPLQSYELSVNRATDRLNYYVSGGFYDHWTVLPKVQLSVVITCVQCGGKSQQLVENRYQYDDGL